MLTHDRALTEARRFVLPLRPVGNGYGFDHFNPDTKVWVRAEEASADYSVASRVRFEHLQRMVRYVQAA